MTPGQQRENERMLASILGVADDDAADLLLQAVQITWAPDDLAGSLLGGFVVQMLRRTFRRVGTPDDPELPEWQGAGLLSQGRRRCRRGRSIRSLSAISPRGRSSGAEQPAFNRQAKVRLPAPAPWSQFRRGVVEWPQTAGFDPVHTGSNPVTPAITPAP